MDPISYEFKLQAIKEKAASNELKQGRWLELVLRAAEWHADELEEVFLLITEDGLGHEKSQAALGRVIKLLTHYFGTWGPGALIPTLKIFKVNNSVGFGETSNMVERLQLPAEGEVIFDFTAGTKAMGAGMVLACVDDRFDLQYFAQLFTDPVRTQALNASREYANRPHTHRDPLPNQDPYAVAWGLLPIERIHGLDFKDGGLLPILVDTDAKAVVSRLDR